MLRELYYRKSLWLISNSKIFFRRARLKLRLSTIANHDRLEVNEKVFLKFFFLSSTRLEKKVECERVPESHTVDADKHDKRLKCGILAAGWT
jgi:hypothetical protein